MDFQDRNAKDVYISHLAITRASRFDKGVYTCQVELTAILHAPA